MHRLTQAFVVLFLLTSPAAAQDPWAKLPAFPTSPTKCYSKDDGFEQALSNVRHELVTAQDRQTETNNAIKDKVSNIDGQTQSAKMIAFMQKDQASAMKFMQEVQSAPVKQQEALDRQTKRRGELDAQLKEATEKFLAELGPIQSLYKSAAELYENNKVAQAKAADAKADQMYVALCAKWLGDKSPFFGYLRDLKQFLTDDVIPAAEESDRFEKLRFQIFGIESNGYKSTATLGAVIEYVDGVQKALSWRMPADPNP